MISKTKRSKVFEKSQWRCVKCGREVRLTIDHRIPKSKGGTDNLSNLQSMCDPCNQEKADKL